MRRLTCGFPARSWPQRNSKPKKSKLVWPRLLALTERDGPGLGGGEGQAELRQAHLPECFVEPLRLNFILEGADEVVGVADQAGFAATLGTDDFVKPKIERIVQVDVSQDRRDDAPLR